MAIIKDVHEGDVHEGQVVRSVLTPPAGEWAGVPMRMFFSVCENAACHCTNLAIALVPESIEEGPGTAVAQFSVDASGKALARHQPSSATKSDLKFAKSMLRHFDESDWSSLWNTFASTKLDFTEDLSKGRTAADFPMAEIETHGEMVPYSRILPFGRQFVIQTPDRSILLNEQYCLIRGCDCDRAAVSFISIENGKDVGREAATIDINYRTGKIVSNLDGNSKIGPSRELFAQFREKYPDLLIHFAKRHKQLVRLYAEFRKSRTQIESSETERVGRNDPCPCGSGRKYKKCCLEV